jgi:hypothetical protein
VTARNVKGRKEENVQCAGCPGCWVRRMIRADERCVVNAPIPAKPKPAQSGSCHSISVHRLTSRGQRRLGDVLCGNVSRRSVTDSIPYYSFILTTTITVSLIVYGNAVSWRGRWSQICAKSDRLLETLLPEELMDVGAGVKDERSDKKILILQCQSCRKNKAFRGYSSYA